MYLWCWDHAATMFLDSLSSPTCTVSLLELPCLLLFWSARLPPPFIVQFVNPFNISKATVLCCVVIGMVLHRVTYIILFFL